MYIFSYKNRIFLSLFLIMSSFSSILLTTIEKSSTAMLLVTSAAGLIIADYINQRFSLRYVALCGSFFALTGSLFVFFVCDAAVNQLGCALLGSATGILLLFIPAVSLVTWFNHLVQGQAVAIWGVSALCGGVLSILMGSESLSLLALCLTALSFGVLLLKSFPAVLKDPYAKMSLFSPLSKCGKYFSFKLFLFFSSAASGMLFFCVEPLLINDSSLFMVIGGAAICPLLVLFFLEKKGLFAALIFLIFEQELSAACFSFAKEGHLLQNAALFLFGGSLTVSLCLYVILYHYLFGAANISKRISGAFLMVPLGMAIAFLIPTAENDRIVLIFFTILCSFFSLFSAWNHRLTLLKSR